MSCQRPVLVASGSEYRAVRLPCRLDWRVHVLLVRGGSDDFRSLARGEHAANVNLAYTSDQIVRTINAGEKLAPKVYINDKLAKPLVFAEGRANPNGPLCNFLQFSGDFELYPSDGFCGGVGMSGLRDAGNNQPNPMQTDRQEWLNKFFRSKNDAAIAKDQNRIMNEVLDEGRLVFAVLQPGVTSFFRNRFITPGGYEMSPIAQWREPAKVPMERSTSQLDPLCAACHCIRRGRARRTTCIKSFASRRRRNCPCQLPPERRSHWWPANPCDAIGGDGERPLDVEVVTAAGI